MSRTSPTVLTIGSTCSLQTPCNVRLGTVTYSYTAPATVAVQGGTGLIYLYVATAGVITVGHNITLICTSTCLPQSGVSAFPPDSVPLATWSVTSGITRSQWRPGFSRICEQPECCSGHRSLQHQFGCRFRPRGRCEHRQHAERGAQRLRPTLALPTTGRRMAHITTCAWLQIHGKGHCLAHGNHTNSRVSCFGPGLWGANINITVTGVTPTQAVIKYSATSSNACTIALSESMTMTPLVNDVNPALFAGSSSDARPGSITSGVARTVVLGKRSVERGLDGNNYSRALQAYTTHYLLVTCGSDSGQSTFRTENPPLGKQCS